MRMKKILQSDIFEARREIKFRQDDSGNVVTLPSVVSIELNVFSQDMPGAVRLNGKWYLPARGDARDFLEREFKKI